MKLANFVVPTSKKPAQWVEKSYIVELAEDETVIRAYYQEA